jgi:trans-aconitate 2-methyltransferase
MIEKARNDYPDMEWVLGDALSIPAGERYDIVFSNAAIQWIPDHGSLIPMLFGLVAKGGALAVQAPKFRDMPMGRIVGSVADRKRWKERTAGCEALFTYNEYGFYYDLLAPTARAMDMWETWYIHVMDSHRGVLDWIRSTALKPYLDRLDGGGEKQAFEDEILEEIEKAYPRQKKGKVLFPFKRLFFIAYT